jgi:hypothetical protein
VPSSRGISGGTLPSAGTSTFQSTRSPWYGPKFTPFWCKEAAGLCCQIQPNPAAAVKRDAAQTAAARGAPSSRASSHIASHPAATPPTSRAMMAAFRSPGSAPRSQALMEWYSQG